MSTYEQAKRKWHIRKAQTMVLNLALDGQYERAAKANNLLTGVLKSFAIQKIGGRFNKGFLKAKKLRSKK
jgi:shikimate kinase